MPAVFPGVDIVLMYGLTEVFRSTYPRAAQVRREDGLDRPGDPRRRGLRRSSPARALPDPASRASSCIAARSSAWATGAGRKRPPRRSARARSSPHLIGDEPVVWSGDTVRVDDDGDLWFVARARRA